MLSVVIVLRNPSHRRRTPPPSPPPPHCLRPFLCRFREVAFLSLCLYFSLPLTRVHSLSAMCRLVLHFAANRGLLGGLRFNLLQRRLPSEELGVRALRSLSRARDR